MLFAHVVVIRRTGVDGASFPLTSTRCVFGRGGECDIRIQLPQIGVEHCRLEVNENKEIFLVNLNEAHSVEVNNECIKGSVRLNHGDVFKIFDRSFRLEIAESTTEKKDSITSSPEKNHKMAMTTNKKSEERTAERSASPFKMRGQSQSPLRNQKSAKKDRGRSSQKIICTPLKSSKLEKPLSTTPGMKVDSSHHFADDRPVFTSQQTASPKFASNLDSISTVTDLFTPSLEGNSPASIEASLQNAEKVSTPVASKKLISKTTIGATSPFAALSEANSDATKTVKYKVTPRAASLKDRSREATPKVMPRVTSPNVTPRTTDAKTTPMTANNKAAALPTGQNVTPLSLSCIATPRAISAKVSKKASSAKATPRATSSKAITRKQSPKDTQQVTSHMATPRAHTPKTSSWASNAKATPRAQNPNASPRVQSPIITPVTTSPKSTPRGQTPKASLRVQSPKATPRATSPKSTPRTQTTVATPQAQSPIVILSATSPMSSPRTQTPTASPNPQSPKATSRSQSLKATPRAQTPAVSPRATSPKSTPRAQSPSALPRATSPKSTPWAQTPKATQRAQSPKVSPRAQSPKDSLKATPQAHTPAVSYRATSPKSTPRAQTPSALPRATSPKSTPQRQSPKATQQAQGPIATPWAHIPKVTPRAQTPKASMKTTPFAQTPKATPQAQTPAVAPRAQSPLSTPRAQTPSVLSRATSPKSTPRVQSPKATQQAQSPKATPRAQSPKATQWAQSPKATPRAQRPKASLKATPFAQTPKDSLKATPFAQTPKATPQAQQTPAVSPRAQSPNSTPRAQTPSVLPRATSPKSTPRVQSPKATQWAQSPKALLKATPLAQTPKASQKATPLAQTTKATPLAQTPAVSPRAPNPTSPRTQTPSATQRAQSPIATLSATSLMSSPSTQTPTASPKSQSPKARPRSQSLTATPRTPVVSPRATSRKSTPRSQSLKATPWAQTPAVLPRETSPKSTPRAQSPKASLKATPFAQTPKATPQAQTPAVSLRATSLKSTPRTQTPAATPRTQSPNSTPNAQTPSVLPMATSPKSSSRAKSPKATPQAQTPAVSLRATSFKSAPRTQTPAATPRAQSPKSTPNAQTPSVLPMATSPKSSSRAQSPKATQRAQSPKASLKATPFAQTSKTTPLTATVLQSTSPTVTPRLGSPKVSARASSLKVALKAVSPKVNPDVSGDVNPDDAPRAASPEPTVMAISFQATPKVSSPVIASKVETNNNASTRKIPKEKLSSPSSTPKSTGRKRTAVEQTSVYAAPSSTKKKRVSFGPRLSPELFVGKLPPATPLRRGGLPPKASEVLASPMLKTRTPAVLPIAGSPIQEESLVKAITSYKVRSPRVLDSYESFKQDQMPTTSKNLSQQNYHSDESINIEFISYIKPKCLPKGDSKSDKKSPSRGVTSPKSPVAASSGRSRSPSPKTAKDEATGSSSDLMDQVTPGILKTVSTRSSPYLLKQNNEPSSSKTATHRKQSLLGRKSTSKTSPKSAKRSRTPKSAPMRTVKSKARNMRSWSEEDFNNSNSSLIKKSASAAITQQNTNNNFSLDLSVTGDTGLNDSVKAAPRSTQSKTRIIARSATKSWADIVKQPTIVAKQLPFQQHSLRVPIVKRQPFKPIIKLLPKTPRTKAAFLAPSTGHAESPATIVIGKKTVQRTPIVIPRKGRKSIHKKIVRKSAGKVSLGGIQKLFKTPCQKVKTSAGRVSLGGVQYLFKTPPQKTPAARRSTPTSCSSTRSFVADTPDSVLYADIPDSPIGPGEMLVSPMSLKSYSDKSDTSMILMGVKELFQNKQPATPASPSGVASLFASPTVKSMVTESVVPEHVMVVDMSDKSLQKPQTPVRLAKKSLTETEFSIDRQSLEKVPQPTRKRGRKRATSPLEAISKRAKLEAVISPARIPLSKGLQKLTSPTKPVSSRKSNTPTRSPAQVTEDKVYSARVKTPEKAADEVPIIESKKGMPIATVSNTAADAIEVSFNQNSQAMGEGIIVTENKVDATAKKVSTHRAGLKVVTSVKSSLAKDVSPPLDESVSNASTLKSAVLVGEQMAISVCKDAELPIESNKKPPPKHKLAKKNIKLSSPKASSSVKRSRATRKTPQVNEVTDEKSVLVEPLDKIQQQTPLMVTEVEKSQPDAQKDRSSKRRAKIVASKVGSPVKTVEKKVTRRTGRTATPKAIVPVKTQLTKTDTVTKIVSPSVIESELIVEMAEETPLVKSSNKRKASKMDTSNQSVPAKRMRTTVKPDNALESETLSDEALDKIQQQMPLMVTEVETSQPDAQKDRSSKRRAKIVASKVGSPVKTVEKKVTRRTGRTATPKAIVPVKTQLTKTDTVTKIVSPSVIESELIVEMAEETPLVKSSNKRKASKMDTSNQSVPAKRMRTTVKPDNALESETLSDEALDKIQQQMPLMVTEVETSQPDAQKDRSSKRRAKIVASKVGSPVKTVEKKVTRRTGRTATPKAIVPVKTQLTKTDTVTKIVSPSVIESGLIVEMAEEIPLVKSSNKRKASKMDTSNQSVPAKRMRTTVKTDNALESETLSDEPQATAEVLSPVIVLTPIIVQAARNNKRSTSNKNKASSKSAKKSEVPVKAAQVEVIEKVPSPAKVRSTRSNKKSSSPKKKISTPKKKISRPKKDTQKADTPAKGDIASRKKKSPKQPKATSSKTGKKPEVAVNESQADVIEKVLSSVNVRSAKSKRKNSTSTQTRNETRVNEPEKTEKILSPVKVSTRHSKKKSTPKKNASTNRKATQKANTTTKEPQLDETDKVISPLPSRPSRNKKAALVKFTAVSNVLLQESQTVTKMVPSPVKENYSGKNKRTISKRAASKPDSPEKKSFKVAKKTGQFLVSIPESSVPTTTPAPPVKKTSIAKASSGRGKKDEKELVEMPFRRITRARR